MKNRVLAFTLAEVLVTLGIIGVVSAMTIPTLMQGYQKKVYSTQLKKVYTEMSQALYKVVNDNNALNLSEAGVYNQATVQSFTSKYFNMIKNCGISGANCFASRYRYINNNSANLAAPTGQSCFVNASGAAICMTTSLITIDVNAQEGPNIVGRDYYQIYLNNDGKLYGSDGGANTETNCKNGSPTYCTFSIMNNSWEMKY